MSSKIKFGPRAIILSCFQEIARAYLHLFNTVSSSTAITVEEMFFEDTNGTQYFSIILFYRYVAKIDTNFYTDT